MQGFIYWLEYVPNLWVRAGAIAILGAIAYFYPDGSTPPQSQWVGPWGACSVEDGRMYEAAPMTDDERLFHALCNALGPIAGHMAYREANRVQGRKVEDATIVGYLQKRSKVIETHGKKDDKA